MEGKGGMSQNISDILSSMNMKKPILSTLAQKGNDNLVQQFLTESVKVSGEERDTANSQLYMASFWGIFDAVKVIVESGTDVNFQNPSSLWTPLHAASFQEHGKVVMFLLENNADPVMKDSMGRTPIDFASASDKVWPLFAVKGFSRTTTADLMEKNILRKPYEQPQPKDNIDMDMNTLRKTNSILPIDYNNPKRSQPSQKLNDRNAYAASVDGDVLAGSVLNETEDQPTFNAWRN